MMWIRVEKLLSDRHRSASATKCLMTDARFLRSSCDRIVSMTQRVT